MKDFDSLQMWTSVNNCFLFIDICNVHKNFCFICHLVNVIVLF